ncbi:formate hydrogenlyase regulator HycA [Escherichia coli]|nr:formate hydrogenlyase regulator HycA [Escherichia coli]
MTIWEISEKADYIAQRHRRLQDQWHIYCNSLVRGDHVIESAPASRHELRAGQKNSVSSFFEHFRIYVTTADGFNSHTIEYYVETKDGEDKQRIAQAQLSIDGMIDGKVNIRDREQVLEHYLEKNRWRLRRAYTPLLKTMCR